MVPSHGKEYDVVDRVFWGSDYVGEDVTEYAALIQREIVWVRTELNKIL